MNKSFNFKTVCSAVYWVINSAVIPFSFPIYIALDERTLSNYLLPFVPPLLSDLRDAACDSLLFNFYLYFIFDVPFFDECSETIFSSVRFTLSFFTPDIFEFDDFTSSFFNNA